jgi:hypothetical protein
MAAASAAGAAVACFTVFAGAPSVGMSASASAPAAKAAGIDNDFMSPLRDALKTQREQARM